MTLEGLINSLLQDTTGSLVLFLPELVLCGTIVSMLLLRIFTRGRVISAFHLALVGSAVALYFAIPEAGLRIGSEVPRQELFSGMLVYDSFTIFFRCLLLGFAVLFCVLTWISGIPDNEDGADFYSLVLGATLGMCLMSSANHLMMIFLSIEMASVPSYVLAGILKGRRKSSEAALKYAVYGAGTAGVMLYGISLLAGLLGTVHLPTMAQQLVAMDIPSRIAEGQNLQEVGVLALGGLMFAVGVAFKLSAVPFHFWCPDVFEGAAAEINALLSVASKAAALALLVRVALGLSYVEPATSAPHAESAGLTATEAVVVSASFNVADHDEHGGEEAEASTPLNSLSALAPVRGFIVHLLAFLAAITCTFGNLAAYGQTNIKRMLAYSTIAHAGYMIMPVAAAVAVIGTSSADAADAIASLTFYISVYLFMNLAVFAVIAFLRNATGSEEIADYAGLIRSCPVVVVCFAATFFSLIGLPPFAGFAAKFAIFESLVTVGGPVMITLLVIAGLNTAISLVYYVRVVKVMTIDPEPDTRGPVALGFIPTAYTVFISLPVLIFGIFFQDVYQWAYAATTHLFPG